MSSTRHTGTDLIAARLDERIHELRGHNVMLDRDLADLYGVEVRALNQAVMRNVGRFPSARAPAAFDSRLEERFARDVARLAPDWDVIREPVPLQAGATLIFPDFLLRHRIHPERQALVEIVGFWTPDYLTHKLARLRQAAPPAFVLCIDEERGCAPSELPPGLPVVTFRRRVDAAAVMREVERLSVASTDAALKKSA